MPSTVWNSIPIVIPYLNLKSGSTVTLPIRNIRFTEARRLSKVIELVINLKTNLGLPNFTACAYHITLYIHLFWEVSPKHSEGISRERS